MKNSHKIVLGVTLVVVAAVLIFVFSPSGNSESDELADFAQCVTDSGAVMYGAYWCGHCQSQKESFGDSWGLVNYVECDPRGNGARPELCEQNGITGYPTWIYGDGQKASGVQQLSTIASRTGCQLP